MHTHAHQQTVQGLYIQPHKKIHKTILKDIDLLNTLSYTVTQYAI